MTAAEARPATWAEYYACRGIEPDSPVALLLTFALSVFRVICLEELDSLERQVCAATVEPQLRCWHVARLTARSHARRDCGVMTRVIT